MEIYLTEPSSLLRNQLILDLVLVDLQRNQIIDVCAAKLAVELSDELYLIPYHGSELKALCHPRFEHLAFKRLLRLSRAIRPTRVRPGRALPLLDPLLLDYVQERLDRAGRARRLPPSCVGPLSLGRVMRLLRRRRLRACFDLVLESPGLKARLFSLLLGEQP